jgi:hypothetical protein
MTGLTVEPKSKIAQDRPKVVVASVYDRFTEGFTTEDLQAARTVLGAAVTQGTQRLSNHIAL